MVARNSDQLNHIEVPMSSWQSGDSHTILETRGLTWCIGIAAYDALNRTGQLLHSVGPLAEHTLVETFFESIKSSSQGTSELTVWVRGNAASNLAQKARLAAIDNREYVESKVATLASANKHIRWGDNGIDMLLDCSNGHFIDAPTVFRPSQTSRPLGLRYLHAAQKKEPFTELDIEQTRNANMLHAIKQFLPNEES